MSEKYEGNYIAVEPIRSGRKMQVVAYFSNHKVAWIDDNLHATRDQGQKHAEFLVKEFSMGSDTNPIPIVQLDDERYVVFKGAAGSWIRTTNSDKVGDVT